VYAGDGERSVAYYKGDAFGGAGSAISGYEDTAVGSSQVAGKAIFFPAAAMGRMRIPSHLWQCRSVEIPCTAYRR